MSDKPIDVVPEKCSKCDGHCCRIYADTDNGGQRPLSAWLEEWCEDWDAMFAATGADTAFKPLFEPLDAHLPGNQHILDELMEKGIDPYSCKYRGRSGCLLPRELRPTICRQYVCREEPTGESCVKTTAK